MDVRFTAEAQRTQSGRRVKLLSAKSLRPLRLCGEPFALPYIRSNISPIT